MLKYEVAVISVGEIVWLRERLRDIEKVTSEEIDRESIKDHSYYATPWSGSMFTSAATIMIWALITILCHSISAAGTILDFWRFPLLEYSIYRTTLRDEVRIDRELTSLDRLGKAPDNTVEAASSTTSQRLLSAYVRTAYVQYVQKLKKKKYFSFQISNFFCKSEKIPIIDNWMLIGISEDPYRVPL